LPPLIIAHRGDSAHRPENTLSAFASALELGAELVEMDVQLSRDGAVVVIHDASVDRTTDGSGRVREMTLAEMRSLSAGYPLRFGHTTALEITDVADVRSQGRAAIERLGLTGVAKLDFKRDMQGNLKLLEINPRFTLWHHAGALAGVNIPALVYADLTGSQRPAPTRVKAGLCWCRPWKDFSAAREAGEPLFA